MEKIDLKKQFKAAYKATTKPSILKIPPMKALMIDGMGDPKTSPEFRQDIEALYGLSYTMKFTLKKEQGLDWTVMGMECLWWADDPTAFPEKRYEEWKYTILVVQPDFVTPKHLRRFAAELEEKKGSPMFRKVRLGTLREGLCAQVLHVGPYQEAPKTIVMLHEFIEAQGKTACGKHHEIYLNDPRRVAPEKLKTIMREPVA
jgi:hypothetical protein